jgi:FkbM family methyltransferase
MFNSVGLDIGRHRSRWTIEGFTELLFHAYNINVVIDVGANVGQYAMGIRKSGFQGRIVSFEPIPASFATLSQNFRDDRGWHGYNKALGKHVAEANMTYNLHQSDMASLYKPASSVPAMFAKWKETERQQVSVMMDTLDNIFDSCIVGITSPQIFLKCDTQGHDLEVLRGGLKALERIRAVQIEIPITHLYESKKSFRESIDTLNEMKFIPCGFYPVTTTGRDKIEVVEFDCIAIRAV